MKYNYIALPHILFIFLTLIMMLVSVADEKKLVLEDNNELAVQTLPDSTRFDLKDIKSGGYKLAGSLNIRRKFMGTRVTPSYQDVVQFHCFNGDELKFSTFVNSDLEKGLLKHLSGGRAIPAIVAVKFELKRIGHDGVNVRDRLVAHIEKCELVTAELICTAAQKAKFDKIDCVRYMDTLDPDVTKDGVSISLGKIYVRSNRGSRAPGLSIEGIKVFNTTAKSVSVEIVGLTIEQEEVKQQCILSKRSNAEKSWKVEALSWSDGIYEKGKTPKMLWMFDPSEEIKPGKKVTVRIELQLNGNELLVVERSVDLI